MTDNAINSPTFRSTNAFDISVKADLSNIRSGTRHAYREKLVAESLLKQLRLETLDVLNKCRKEIDEFRSSSKERMSGLHHPSSVDLMGVDVTISDKGDKLPSSSANSSQSETSKIFYSQEYVQSLENKVAELTLALEARNTQPSDVSLASETPCASITDSIQASEEAESNKFNNPSEELDKYKMACIRLKRELSIANEETDQLRSNSKLLLMDLSSCRQENSILRVRVIELEGLVEGLRQRSASMVNAPDFESTAVVARSGDENMSDMDSISPVKMIREPNSTSKEISQLLESVHLVLSATPRQSGKQYTTELQTEGETVSTKLMDEFLNS